MSNDSVLSVEDYAEDVEHTGLMPWNYYKVLERRWQSGGCWLKNPQCEPLYFKHF